MRSPSNRRGDATDQTSDKCYSEAVVASPTVQELRLRWMAAQSKMDVIAEALDDLRGRHGQELAEFWAVTDRKAERAEAGHEIRHTLAQRQAAAAERNARLFGTDPSWHGR